MACRIDRRSFLRGSAAAGAAMLAVRGPEEARLLAALENPTEPEALRERAGEGGRLPTGKLGKLTVSRLIAGGNIISGWCHQRDLLYVSTLAGQYLTEEKQFDTLEMMEEYGINTCSPDPSQMEFINKYKQERGGRIQTVVGVHEDWAHFDDPSWDRLKECIDQSIDDGATTLYTQGGYTEHALKTGKPANLEIIGRAVEYIRQQGCPAGIGCHDILVIEACDQAGIVPDYYFKTMHHDRYWSAHPRANRKHWSVDAGYSEDHDEYHDNMYDLFPEKTVALMAGRKQPWIAFKTLAAGAIHPKSAFEYCFGNGADFIAVGMFDFQVVEDTLIAKEVLARESVKNRARAWCA